MSLDERSADESWDAAALKSEFRSLAANRDTYLNELPSKIGRNKAYEVLFDQTLADYQVYENLSFGTFLDSRKSALAALAKFVGNDLGPPAKAYEVERFFTHRANLVKNLLERFQQPK